MNPSVPSAREELQICSLIQVRRYRERISGPLLDRIDIHLEVGSVTYQEMAGKELGESSEAMRERVVQAREIQRERFGKMSKVHCNARMSPKLIKSHCPLDETGEGMMQMAMTELNLSARAYDRILKVSARLRTLPGASRRRRNMWPRRSNTGRASEVLSRKLRGDLSIPYRERVEFYREEIL